MLVARTSIYEFEIDSKYYPAFIATYTSSFDQHNDIFCDWDIDFPKDMPDEDRDIIEELLEEWDGDFENTDIIHIEEDEKSDIGFVAT